MLGYVILYILLYIKLYVYIYIYICSCVYVHHMVMILFDIIPPIV